MSLIDTLLLESVPLGTPAQKLYHAALRIDGAVGSGTIDDPFNGSTLRRAPISIIALEEVGAADALPNSVVIDRIGTTLFRIVSSAHRRTTSDYVITGTGNGSSSFNGVFRVRELLPDDSNSFSCILPTAPPLGDDPQAPFTCHTAFLIRATTHLPHGYAVGDVVEISGFTGGAADHYFGRTAADYYTGKFIVDEVTADTFTFKVACSPFRADTLQSGSATCARISYCLDSVLRDRLPPYSALHLGPGVFETRGTQSGRANAQGIQEGAITAQAGWRILGSGIEVTVLRVVAAGIPSRNEAHAAFGPKAWNERADGMEVSDLTVDSDMAAHPFGSPYSTLSKSGVTLIGRDSRIRRVSTRGFGTQTPYAECFAIVAPGSHPLLPEMVNTVIDECIIERPSFNNVRETTCIGASGHLSTYFRGVVARDCVLNGGGIGVPIRVIEISKEAAERRYRITTIEPHGRTANNNITLFGIEYSNTPATGPWVVSRAFSGTFLINEVSEYEIVFTLPLDPQELRTPEPELSSNPENYSPVRAFVGNGFHGPGVNGGTACASRHNRIYRHRLGANHDTFASKDAIYEYNYNSDVHAGFNMTLGGSLGGFEDPATGSALTRDADLATFITAQPHRLLPGDGVRISDALAGGTSQNAFNGCFEIETVPSIPNIGGKPCSFTYRLKGQLPESTSASGAKWAHYWRGRHIVLERNIIEVGRSPTTSWITGIYLATSSVPESGPRVFRRYAAQENLIRHLREVAFAQTPDEPANRIMAGPVAGISTVSCDQATVQRNVIGLAGIDREVAVFERCEEPSAFNNHRPTGKPVAAFNNDSGRSNDEVGTRIEDALCAALL